MFGRLGNIPIWVLALRAHFRLPLFFAFFRLARKPFVSAALAAIAPKLILCHTHQYMDRTKFRQRECALEPPTQNCSFSTT